MIYKQIKLLYQEVCNIFSNYKGHGSLHINFGIFPVCREAVYPPLYTSQFSNVD